MKIALVLRDGSPPRMATRAYAPQTDDVRSILIDLCEAMAPFARFCLAGFGQDPWPVDVRTDLAIFLEQLPTLLQAVERGAAAEVDLYGQGVQRTIHFEPDGKYYRMTCASRASWQPDPAVERIERGDLLAQLELLQAKVIAVLGDSAPDLLVHPWIREWGDGGANRRYQ